MSDPRSPIDRAIDKIKRDCQDPEWLGSIEAQAHTFIRLQQLRGSAYTKLYEDASVVLGKALGLSPKRLDGILQLDHPEQFRRALRAEPITEHFRLPYEEIYPKTGWLGDYLLQVQHTENPLAWHFWTGVAVFASALRRNFYVEHGDYQVWPNHYIFLIGPSALGKNLSIEFGQIVVNRLNRLLEDADVPEDRRIRMTPRRCTPERFLQMMKTDRVQEFDHELGVIVTRFTEATGLVLVPEMVTLLGKDNFHSGQWIHVVTDIYGCPEVWDISTIGRGDEQLRNVAINCLFGSTFDWIRESATEEMFKGGFFGRFIFVPRSKNERPAHRIPLDPVAMNELAERLYPLATAAPTEFDSSRYWSWYDDWREHNRRVCDEISDDRLGGYFRRKPSHVLKLGTILALAQDRGHGKIEDLELALRLLDMEEGFLPKAMEMVHSSREALLCDHVLSILGKWGGKLTYGTLARRASRRVANARELNNLLDALEHQGKVTRQRQSLPSGRTSVLVELTENALDDDAWEDSAWETTRGPEERRHPRLKE